MSFQDLEIKTAGLILKFSQIENDKQGILKNLKSRKTPVFGELKKLLSLLEEQEMPLLNIVLKELEFIEEHKRGLKRLALRQGHDHFYWKILERTGRLRRAVLRFLERAKSDAALTRRIIEAWETSSKANLMSRWIKQLIRSLSKDIQLEGRLKEAEAYHILDDYLRFAEGNIPDPRLKDIVAVALRRTNLAKIAACFLIAFMSLGSLQKTYAAEPQPAAQAQSKIIGFVNYIAHFGNNDYTIKKIGDLLPKKKDVGLSKEVKEHIESILNENLAEIRDKLAEAEDHFDSDNIIMGLKLDSDCDVSSALIKYILEKGGVKAEYMLSQSGIDHDWQNKPWNYFGHIFLRVQLSTAEGMIEIIVDPSIAQFFHKLDPNFIFVGTRQEYFKFIDHQKLKKKTSKQDLKGIYDKDFVIAATKDYRGEEDGASLLHNAQRIEDDLGQGKKIIQKDI
ncbi:MAG: hypothetical protein KKC75_02555 [Nanoarchaeota archaeon]|nr:hypothetical protein [Nanoarchaeota archaeon]MBU1946382.1 hypothetical protein [Nanoarchaeota archaeon]